MSLVKTTIERIKSSSSISDIVRSMTGLNVERAGNGRLKVCCPFHTEKTASCFLEESDNTFHCFGCGEGGDVIHFVSKLQNISFVDAVKSIADSIGIDISNELNNSNGQEERKKNLHLFELFDTAMSFYSEQLYTPSGQDCLEYFRNKRGLSDETIKSFSLGFASGSSSLFRHLKAKGFQEDVIFESGMVKNVNGSLLDFFYNRAMIPIINSSSYVIGFGGRSFVADSIGPKYINTSESALFKKGEMLFNMSRASLFHRSTKRNLVVVEGYMDVIVASQYGCECFVAPLGTAMTPVQIKMLLSCDKSPIICFNSDNAGCNAMVKCAERFMPELKVGIVPRFAIIPSQFKDIDEMICYYSNSGKSITEVRESVFSFLDTAIEMQDFLWKNIKSSLNATNPNSVASVMHKIDQMCSVIGDNSVQSAYSRFLKMKLNNMVYNSSRSNPGSVSVKNMWRGSSSRLAVAAVNSTDQLSKSLLLYNTSVLDRSNIERVGSLAILYTLLHERYVFAKNVIFNKLLLEFDNDIKMKVPSSGFVDNSLLCSIMKDVVLDKLSRGYDEFRFVTDRTVLSSETISDTDSLCHSSDMVCKGSVNRLIALLSLESDVYDILPNNLPDDIEDELRCLSTSVQLSADSFSGSAMELISEFTLGKDDDFCITVSNDKIRAELIEMSRLNRGSFKTLNDKLEKNIFDMINISSACILLSVMDNEIKSVSGESSLRHQKLSSMISAKMKLLTKIKSYLSDD